MPVTILSRALRACGLGLLLTLAACNGPPWALSQSPDGIRLRWYTDTTPAAAAQQVAQLHCATGGRRAALVADEVDGSAEIADYACR